MSIFFGLDAGTTTLSAVALQVPSGEILATWSGAVAPQGASGRAGGTLDLDALCARATEALGRLGAACGRRARDVAGIGVTGQMHGLALLAPDGRPLAPAITWQDARALEPDARGETALASAIRLAGGQAAWDRAGCLPAAGYTGVLLHALARSGGLPQGRAVACTVPDALVAALSGGPPRTDPTDGASTGLFDVVAGRWDLDLAGRLGIPAALLPPVCPSGEPAGGLRAAVAEAAGLAAGVPVCIACGDNQASFLGAAGEREGTALLNVGTGAQVSAWLAGWVPPAERAAGLEVRPFPRGGYLLVGAELCGGASLAALAGGYADVGRRLFGYPGDGAALYPLLDALAAEAPAGAGGLRLEPWFAGSRRDPGRRARLTGMTEANLTAGNVARALYEGLAEVLAGLAERMSPPLDAPRRLAGAGNALRLSVTLRTALSARLGLPLEMPACPEPAAAGAALLAAVGCGALGSVAEAMRLVRRA